MFIVVHYSGCIKWCGVKAVPRGKTKLLLYPKLLLQIIIKTTLVLYKYSLKDNKFCSLKTDGNDLL